MKPKLAPRHIIPTVCYALLLVGFVSVALIGCSIDFSSSESLEGSGIVGLLVVGIAVAAKFILILLGVGGSLAMLFPLVFSAINIAKRERKLAIACLVFDILGCQAFLSGTLATLIDFESPIPVIVAALCLALYTLSLVMNILNIKRNGPLPEREEETLPTELMP